MSDTAEEIKNKDSVTAKIKEWLTPGLILIVSFFVKTWMNDVDDKLNQITALQSQVTAITVKQEANIEQIKINKNDIKKLNDDFIAFVSARKEDEVTIESLKRRK